MYTTFGFKWEGESLFLTHAPQTWNRDKVVALLEDMIEKKDNWLKDYIDSSSQTFKIELVYKKGEKPTEKDIKALFNKENLDTLSFNVITHEGRLKNHKQEEIIKRFCDFRKTHLIRRFKRLAGLEQEFENQLKNAKFKYFEWLASIPVYRMTLEEAKKCQDAINEAKIKFAEFTALSKQDAKLTAFMIDELTELKNKWDK